ncbi:hydrogenase maturation protease [Grimontia hollisae]|uniref:hydrogenase maturation protease n=1 Tax=Grimontia hollisae TaxID=673 RepID=UPI0023D9DB60|nr:hydrogenase maturation protease [Grimontia hollisae]MDF2186295.1 hydrogenase maturation protease [Grimontia hollisae]
METLRILCFGNTLHSDDGIGSAIALRLQGETLPTGVEIYDVGISGLNALSLFEGCTAVLIVDAADMGLSPGSVRFVSPRDISVDENTDHMGGVGYLLQAVNAVTKPSPDIVVLAVQPAVYQRFSPQVSPHIDASLDKIVTTITAYARRHTLVKPERQRYPT